MYSEEKRRSPGRMKNGNLRNSANPNERLEFKLDQMKNNTIVQLGDAFIGDEGLLLCFTLLNHIRSLCFGKISKRKSRICYNGTQRQ
jgi:hypothetical protein